MQPVKRVAVVIPGIMGSCLETKAGLELWTENIRANYKRLVRNPAVLQYDGTPANAPRVLEEIRFLGVFWKSLFGLLLRFLRKEPAFAHPIGVLTFAYDWRESVTASAQNLRQLIDQKLKGLRK